MARPHNHSHLSLLLLRLLLLLPAATAAPYSSLCHFPAVVRDDHSRDAPLDLPRISTGHFSGGGDLLFAPGLRSFSFSPRHSSASATTDPAVTHLSATLTLEGTRRRGDRPHSVSFDLDGYYSTATAATATGELCMVGSGSYAREDGFGVVLLSDVVLRLRVPHPSNLSTPFVTGRLGGAHFNPISLVAYSEDDDYEYGNAASCPPPPSLPAGGTRRHVLLRAGFSRCGRLRALIGTRSSYTLEYRPNGGGHAAASGGFPLRPGHRRMYVNQMRCAADGAVRAYMVFYAANPQDAAAPSSNYTAARWRRGPGFLVGDEALVADGFWDSSRGWLCLRACRVVRSGQSSADLAVGACGIGVSLWFPAVWSVQDRSVAAGMIWNASGGGGGDMAGVISVSRTGGYAGNMSEIRYKYTLVEEAKKHYDSMPELSRERKGRFPGNYSYADLSLYFSVKRKGFTGNGYASPFTIGSAFVQGGGLMSDDDADAFRRLEAGEMSKQQRLLNVSYDVGYWLQRLDHTSRNISQGDQRSFSAEGVYDTKTGSLCMVACQDINNSSDCEVLITVQFTPTDAKSRERAVGTIRSLRKQSDPLFFEPLDLVAHGMTAMQWAESSSRMDMESVMLVASMALSCAFTALQLRHVRKHPEALPAMSVTMLAVLALGYVVPLVLNLEDMYRDTRKQFFVKLTTGGSLELNEFMLRASTMLAFVLQLRLLQLALSRRSTDQVDQAAGSKHGEGGPSPADAERSTLWICLPLYALGAVVVWIAHMNAPPGRALVDNNHLAAYAGPALVDNLAAYAGLVLDGFLLPQVVWNAFAGSGRARRAPALSPWFYAGGSVIRAAPHAYDVFRKQRYVPSWRPSYVYANPRDDLFGVGWDVSVPCGAAALAALVFLQQRLGGAFLCGLKSRRRSGGYEMASSVSS